jgi:hypothetical protein
MGEKNRVLKYAAVQARLRLAPAPSSPTCRINGVDPVSERTGMGEKNRVLKYAAVQARLRLAPAPSSPTCRINGVDPIFQ